MPSTTHGLVYPASTDHTRVWEHFQTLADDADDLITLRNPAPGATPPTGVQAGTVWWNTTLGRLEVYTGSAWAAVDSNANGGTVYAAADQTTYTASSTLTQDTTASVTFTTATNNVKVVVDVACYYSGMTANGAQVQLFAKVDGTAVLTSGVATQSGNADDAAPSAYPLFGRQVVNLATAGSHTILARAYINGNGASTSVGNTTLTVTPAAN